MRILVHRKARRKVGPKAPVRVSMPITKGDTIQVISGEFKGQRGTVLRVIPKSGRVVVDGIKGNVVKRHLRARSADQPAGIVERPGSIHHSNLMLIDPKTGEPTRVRRKRDKDGTVERIAVKSGQSIARNR